MKQSKFFNQKSLYLYYGVLLVLMFFFSMRYREAAPFMIRAGMTIAAFLPFVFNRQSIILALSCVWMINLYSFCTVMLDAQYLYLAMALLYLFSEPKGFSNCKKLCCIWAYFALISLIYFDNQQFLTMTIVGMAVFSGVNDESDLKLLDNSLVMVALYFSILFLFNREAFTIVYNEDLGLERSGWMNANVFGSFVSLGSVIAVGHLTRHINIQTTPLERWLYIATAALGLMVLLVNASRGALLTFVISTALFVFLSGAGKSYKILFVVAMAFLAFILYNQGYFELILYRMELDSNATVGNRSQIWKSKLEAFSQFNVFETVFGISRNGCFSIRSGGVMMSTHNDFITALVGYGLVGLLLYVILYVKTFFKADRTKRLSVLVLLLAMAMEAAVAEPIFRGHFMSIVFFVFIYKFATIPSGRASEQ